METGVAGIYYNGQSVHRDYAEFECEMMHER